MLPVTGKGAHNDTSKGISWKFRESFLTMTMSHVIVPCLWRSFYSWLTRLSTGDEWRMIASIRILVWRRECRRNMLIRHWHFLFPPTTEIHTLKNYISHLYMSSIHDQHIILGTQERVLWILGSRNYLTLLIPTDETAEIHTLKIYITLTWQAHMTST